MYRIDEQEILHEIICNASVYIREAVNYGGWNDENAGHAVIFFLNEATFGKINSFELQNRITQRLNSDLIECSKSLNNEHIYSTALELFDENDTECNQSIKPFAQPIINPDSLDIWKPGYIRLFISHRDENKKEVAELAVALEGYGISAFVAHNTIEPMEEWQHVIRKALQSMEVMLAFITDTFFESFWTNQEIGFAIGKGIPIIPLKLQKKDPEGFISILQALPGDLALPSASLDGVYKILSEKLGQEDRLRKAAIQAFVSSNTFDEAKIRFERLKKIATLMEADIQQIIDGFSNNDQLHKAIYLVNHYNRLVSFLEDKTGKRYKIEGKVIKLAEDGKDGEIPF